MACCSTKSFEFSGFIGIAVRVLVKVLSNLLEDESSTITKRTAKQTAKDKSVTHLTFRLKSVLSGDVFRDVRNM